MTGESRRTARAVQQRSVATRAALLEGAGRTFSRLPYSEARLKDIADESSISQGSLYFHFGNKSDVAEAILQLQQERMTSVLSNVAAGSGTGLAKLLALVEGLADLIASDQIVQAGIRLSTQIGTGLSEQAREPYLEWIRIAESLIVHGVEDGSLEPTTDITGAAEYVNYLFVGAQVLSEIDSNWSSFPDRAKKMRPYIVASLGSATS